MSVRLTTLLITRAVPFRTPPTAPRKTQWKQLPDAAQVLEYHPGLDSDTRPQSRDKSQVVEHLLLLAARCIMLLWSSVSSRANEERGWEGRWLEGGRGEREVRRGGREVRKVRGEGGKGSRRR